MTFELHVCRTCRRPLDYHQAAHSTTGTYRHPAYGAPYDHTVDPIPAATVGNEMVGVCDFCCAPSPRWLYNCTDFVMDSIVPNWASVGAWMACNLCHRNIAANDWAPLLERAALRHPVEAHDFIIDRLSQLFDSFRLHRAPHPPVDTLRR